MTMYAPSAVKLREYERIFVGTNEEYGYENPFLGFVIDSITIEFLPDTITYFHYPSSAPMQSLSGSTLIDAGAVAGAVPYHSDKIWKKMADYASYIYWGDSQQTENGVWLCSWLSGNPENLIQRPVWMDRWYTPGIMTYEAALTSISGIYLETFPVLWDTISDMTLDPGVWYRYFHVGDSHNEFLVDSLTANNALKIHFDQWTEPTTMDESGNENVGYLEGYAPGMISNEGVNPARPTDNCIDLNGVDQHSQSYYTSSYDVRQDFSTSVWVYADDWDNMQGQHLVSKDNRGGWALTYNNGFFTPYMTILDSASGVMTMMNSNGLVYVSRALPGTGEPVMAVRDEHLYSWVLDNGLGDDGQKSLYRLDYTGDISLRVPFSPTYQLCSIALDHDFQIWVQATNSATASSFNIYTGDRATTQPIPLGVRAIDIGLTGGLSAVDCDDMVIDNNNALWFVSGGAIYKDHAPIFSSDEVTRITCDRSNNLWALSGSNLLLKLSNTGAPLLSAAVGTDTTAGARAFGVVQEFVEDEYVDYMWVIQANTRRVYKYDMAGTPVDVTVIRAFSEHPYVKGDFTGYQWDRKFNYLTIQEPQMQFDLYLYDGSTSYPTHGKYTVKVPTSEMANKSWHMFTVVACVDRGCMKLYMDVALRDTISMPASSTVYYEYENPLMLGATTGKIRDLDAELKIAQTHFKGKIDDFRIYNRVINNSDIKYLYMSKFDYQTLEWNMPTGEQNYLEQIQRFFKFKLPGAKSHYYNIRLAGLGITDPDVRLLIEDIIRDTVTKVAPAYTELYKIIWE